MVAASFLQVTKIMRLISLAAVLVISLLSGCAATVARTDSPTTTIAASPAATKSILLEVSPSDKVTTDDNWEAFLEEWQTSMTAAASNKGASFTLLKAGERPKQDAAVLVKMKVNDFKYVSQAKRYGMGIFSGNAFMDLDVEFLEYPQGKSLGTRKFQTTSSAWQGVFSAMTPKQVEAASKEIVEEVAGK